MQNQTDIWNLVACEYIHHATAILSAAGEPVDLPNLLDVFSQNGRSRQLLEARGKLQIPDVRQAVDYFDRNLRLMHSMTFRSLVATVEEMLSKK